MAVSSAELDRIFSESFSPRLQTAIIRCLFGAYQTAAERCSIGLPEEEASVLLPYYRWLQLKADMRRLGQRSSEVDHEDDRYHVLLSVGQINLTISTVDAPGSFVRPAVYRATYANDSQLHLFSDNAAPTADAAFYSILIHGPDPKNLSQPLFAQMAFPDQRLDHWVHKIDIFGRHASLVNSLRSGVTVSSGNEATVKIRKMERENCGA